MLSGLTGAQGTTEKPPGHTKKLFHLITDCVL